MYILFVRHGLSYANLNKENDSFYIFTAPLDKDSKLTPEGLQQAKYISKVISELSLDIVPVIFSSILTRSIQTANEIANVEENVEENKKENKENEQKKLIVIPFIEEFPLNKFIPIDQQNQPRNIYEVIEETKIKLDVIGTINPYNRDGDPILRTNTQKFYKLVVPEIIKYLESRYTLNENSTIVVVSHRKVIQHMTGYNLENCGLVLQNLSNMKSEVLLYGL